MKKTPRNNIILHKCTKIHDHKLYCSWDMARDGCNCYFSFWATFLPFYPLTTQKMKISKKWKKHLAISSIYIIVPKTMIMCYTAVPEIWHVADVIVIFWGAIFCPWLPHRPKNQISQKWKKHLEIIIHMCTKNCD